MFGQFRCADAQAPNASLFQQKRARCGARFDRHDPVVRRKGRPDRRGRSLSPYGSRSAQLSRPHRAQRSHVRTARLLYVYRSYGIHWCVNFVCEPEGSASAVLIRAIEPTGGLQACAAGAAWPTSGFSPGPGRVCEALGITAAHNALPLDEPPFELFAREARWRSWPACASASPKPPRSRGAMG